MYQNRRCNLGDGQPDRLTLKQCQEACDIGCSFFLYYESSPYRENCWVGNLSQSVTEDCVEAEDGWTVYSRKTVEWKSIPNTRCYLGNGIEYKQTLEQCKAQCPEDTCPFFLYHPDSPFNENCWIANQTQATTFENTCFSESGYTVYYHAWTPVQNMKCNFGDGYVDKISLDECKALCPEDSCPFFLYNPNSPFSENCWLGSSTNSISDDCAPKDGYTLYKHASMCPKYMLFLLLYFLSLITKKNSDAALCPQNNCCCFRKHLKSVFSNILKASLARLVVYPTSTFPLAKKNSKVYHAMISENMGSPAIGCGHNISWNVQAVNVIR